MNSLENERFVGKVVDEWGIFGQVVGAWNPRDVYSVVFRSPTVL